MGHSQVAKSTTHRRIVDVAARRFREFGLDEIGVADVMKEAGLTVGGFYRHFASRDDLVVEALAASCGAGTGWQDGAGTLEAAVAGYLSENHRDAPGTGCALGALMSDVGRSGEAARAVYTETAKRSLAGLTRLVGGADDDERRAQAILVLAACLGAIGLSRAVSDSDLSGEILKAVADGLLRLQPSPTGA